jgi:hypothetical protein
MPGDSAARSDRRDRLPATVSAASATNASHTSEFNVPRTILEQRIPLASGAAISVVVFQSPWGTLASSWPEEARPYTWIMLVLAQVWPVKITHGALHRTATHWAAFRKAFCYYARLLGFFACLFSVHMEIFNSLGRCAEVERSMHLRPELYSSCNNASKQLGDIVFASTRRK